MIEVVDSIPHLSVCKHPIISLLIPNTWVEEAQVIASLDPGKRNKAWAEARIIGCKAFAVYYGLKDQWMVKAKTDMMGYNDIEYVISSGKDEYIFRTHTILHKDRGAGLDKLNTRLFKSPNDYMPIYHVICWYSTPRLYIIGYKPNDELDNKTEMITQSNIYPIFGNKILASLDNKGYFI